MRLNAELAARAWVILGSLIVGVSNMSQSVIHDFNVPFIKLTKNLELFFEITLFIYFFFHFILLHIMGELAWVGSVAVAVA